jgi:hypothetical protein
MATGANINATKTHLQSTRIIERNGVVKWKITSLNTECGKRENNMTQNLNLFNKEVKRNGRENCCKNCLKKYDILMKEYRYKKSKV